MAEPESDDSIERIAEVYGVGSRFEDVVAYAMTTEGYIDLQKLERLEGRFGYNGGRGCDVLTGLCSCGAWH